MTATLKIISPVDGSVYAERPLADGASVLATLERARVAQRAWRHVPVAERCRIGTAFTDAMVADKARVSELLAWQMGRPIRYGPGEVRGFEERARYMIAVAPESLADIDPGPKDGFKRHIRREPLGVVLNLPAWNFPYMTALNAVLPAILAGNAVVMKHSSQTALVAEHFADCFRKADLPPDVFQVLHMSHEATEKAIRSGLVDQVGFTGSTAGGRAIMAAVAGAPNFPATCLELGGKDPAYVRPDADLAFAVENIVDAGFFNSGQSCCAIERIYVHEDVYDDFVDGAVTTINAYKLGSPVDQETTLGPLVRTKAADFVRAQVEKARRKGARPLIDVKRFASDKPDSPYLAPQLLADVDHSMEIMTEETFGPAHGVMRVKSDEEAIRLMNDSPFGLTASVWTADVDAAERIGDAIQTGTVYMNRADYLDPALAWVGVKQSGRGVTLSKVGYEHLTRPKSFHLPDKDGLRIMRYLQSVLQPGETVLYQTRISRTTYVPGLIVLLVAIVLFTVIRSHFPSSPQWLATSVGVILGAVALYLLARAWFERWTTEIAITNERIILKRGFIRRDTAEMHMDKVESIDVNQSFFGRLLNYGDVTVRGTGAGLETLRLIDAPLVFRNHVKTHEHAPPPPH